ncbi:MAG: mechanosensitive ion channel [Nitrospirae bacterium]|nr:mechanosensitive ion channel [Nitrospirota bacterium]
MPNADVLIEWATRYGPNILAALVILAIGVFVARWVGNALQSRLDKLDMEPPVRLLLVRVTRIVILLFALMAMLDKLGVQTAPLLAGIGVAGVGIGLALQGVLSNVMAGLSIIFTKPYRVGEHISLLGVHGDVSVIDIFSTTLIHPDHSRIVIPNRKVVGEILHNSGTIRQLHLTVGLSYQADITKALTAAQEVLAENPRVLKTPSPSVGISTLGDHAVVVAVEPWVKVADYGTVQGELNQAIVERFRAGHIELPCPRQEVRLLSTP